LSADSKFPKAVRLLTAADYSKIFQDVQLRVSSQNYLILASEQKLNTARLGIIVAKKNVKLAVERNRIKRLLRESFRHQRTDLPFYDVIVLVKKGANLFDNKAHNAELDYLWRKLKRKVIAK
jgi:ribonuclease P protein component